MKPTGNPSRKYKVIEYLEDDNVFIIEDFLGTKRYRVDLFVDDSFGQTPITEQMDVVEITDAFYKLVGRFVKVQELVQHSGSDCYIAKTVRLLKQKV